MYKQLTKPERQLIEKYWLSGKSKRKIAEMLDRSHSTICYAINNVKNWDWIKKRNGKVVKVYSAKKAEKNFVQNKSKCGAKFKFTKDPKLLEYIENCVKAGESPKQVVGRIELDNLKFDTTINARTIYNYVEHGNCRITPFDLRFKLRRRLPKHRKIRENKRKMGKSIDERPENINNRTEFGHWEGDCIVDKNDNAILVLVERISRLCLMRKLEKHESKEVLEKVRRIREEHLMKSLTVDNGSEFYKITQLEDENFEVYFTHPYSSFEKGSVENLNGIIRRYIPKGEDISFLTQSTVDRIQNQVNSLPREIHGFYTAAEVHLSLTTNQPRTTLPRPNNVIFLKPRRSS